VRPERFDQICRSLCEIVSIDEDWLPLRPGDSFGSPFRVVGPIASLDIQAGCPGSLVVSTRALEQIQKSCNGFVFSVGLPDTSHHLLLPRVVAPMPESITSRGKCSKCGRLKVRDLSEHVKPVESWADLSCSFFGLASTGMMVVNQSLKELFESKGYTGALFERL